MFQDLLHSKTKQFDVIFIEMLPFYECFLPLAEKLGVPIIATFSMRPWINIDTVVGNPHPLVIPNFLSPFPQKMVFAERLINAWLDIYFTILVTHLWNPLIVEYYQQYFPNYNLKRNRLSLLFTNNHASIFSMPKAPNVIEIPGIHLKPVQPLPQVSK